MPAARHDEIRDEDLHGLAMLVERRRPDLDQPLLGTRFRRSYLQHFTFKMQLVVGPHRRRPAELIEPGADDAAGGSELALDEEPHGERRRVPAARGQSAEEGAACGLLVEMEALRIEFAGKRRDLRLVDAQPSRAEFLADGEVLEKSRRAHRCPPACSMRQAIVSIMSVCPAYVRGRSR